MLLHFSADHAPAPDNISSWYCEMPELNYEQLGGGTKDHEERKKTIK